MKPSRTINQLHFEDLDPIRFEELILGMVYRSYRWESINHFGKKGSDDGIDIEAVERLENGKLRKYHYQCKRYNRLSKSQLKKIIDDYLMKNPYLPDKYILVVSCSLSKTNIDYLCEYAMSQGLSYVDVWTSSVIETKLYSDYHDLLFSYFGISLSSKRNDIIATVRRNISLKHKMKRDFYKDQKERNPDVRERICKPYENFICNHILIRSIDDVCYPENNLLVGGHYAYQKSKIYNFYHNGIIVFASALVKEIVVKRHIDDNSYEPEKILAYEFGYLPYNNIIDYDIDGDEFYQFPHLFCDFSGRDHPYEFIRYAEENEGEFWILQDDDILNTNP